MSRLWEPTRGPRRGPRPKLSLSEIVGAAVRVARADGLPAVTMARVADAAGCAKMALYRHVSDRDDLVSAMIDAALGTPPQLAGSWRERFDALWDALLEVYAADPWMLELPADVNAVTPRNVAWIDEALGILEGSRVPPTERLSTVLLVTETIRFDARTRRSSGVHVSDLDSLLVATVHASGHLPADRFPHLAALSSTGQLGEPAHPGRPDHLRELMLRSLTGFFPDEVR